MADPKLHVLPDHVTKGATPTIAPVETVPVVRFSVQSQIDGGRNPKTMSIETYIAQDAPLFLFHGIADRIGAVLRRQTAINERENLLEHIRHIEKDIVLVRMQMAKIELRINERAEVIAASGRRNVKEPENEASNRRALLDKLEANAERIKEYREQVAEMDRIIADVGLPHGSADHQPRV